MPNITADDLLDIMSPEDEAGSFTLRLAKVAGTFPNGCPKIQFWGEEAPSEKVYPYLAPYFPTVGEKVLMLKAFGTYIILPNMVFNKSPTRNDFSNLVTKPEMTTALGAYAKTTDADNKYASKDELSSAVGGCVKMYGPYIWGPSNYADLAAVINWINNSLLPKLTETGLLRGM